MNSEARPSSCPSFEGCKAPLCPLDKSLYQGAIWYTDEDVCATKEFRSLNWVRKQRKLKKARRKGFFNLEMLEALGNKTVDGIDPDSNQTVEAWVRERTRRRVGGKPA